MRSPSITSYVFPFSSGVAQSKEARNRTPRVAISASHSHCTRPIDPPDLDMAVPCNTRECDSVLQGTDTSVGQQRIESSTIDSQPLTEPAARPDTTNRWATK